MLRHSAQFLPSEPEHADAERLQVGLTDNAPIYIMGGLVMPLGEGGMVTDAARNSSLTLVVRSRAASLHRSTNEPHLSSTMPESGQESCAAVLHAPPSSASSVRIL